MATLQTSDVIFATVSRCGTTIATLKLSGMSSLAQIFNYIKTVLSGTMGLLTVNLRNGTQGWNERYNLMLKQMCSLKRADIL